MAMLRMKFFKTIFQLLDVRDRLKVKLKRVCFYETQIQTPSHSQPRSQTQTQIELLS